MSYLPKIVTQPCIPPVKCQGIKSKLIDFITQSIRWDGNGTWIEPFLGSGVVVFNIQPPKALLSDINPHIITLYQEIQKGSITAGEVKNNLEQQGKRLAEQGQPYYNEVRSRFNEHPNSLDFIFLNRSCFNGVMRFNSKGHFNVPFGHKPERFRQAYITKIINQINHVKTIMQGKEWEFKVSDWRESLSTAHTDDFVYLDPPYIGRHADYYSHWDETQANELTRTIQSLPCGFALSLWLENKYRRNEHIDDFWKDYTIKSFSHFYHVGSSEDLRNEMQEALILSDDSVSENIEIINGRRHRSAVQVPLF